MCPDETQWRCPQRIRSPYHDIEYIMLIYASWPITFGYGIIEALKVRRSVAWIHLWKLGRRMCPDET